MNRNAFLLLGALCLAGAPASAQEPGAEEVVLNPQASVEEDNEAVLELKVGQSPREMLFEQVKHSASGAPQSEEMLRYGADGKVSGRMVALFAPSGKLLAHEFYDGAGKLLSSARGVAAKGKPFVVQATSSPKPIDGRPLTFLSAIVEGGFLLADYQYDKSGRLISSRHPVAKGLEGAEAEYFYSPDGLPLRKVLRLARGITSVALYDATGKRHEQTIDKPGKGKLQISYLYNTGGHLSRAKMRLARDKGVPEETHADFRYDKAGRFEEQEVQLGGMLAMRAKMLRDDAGKMLGIAMHSFKNGKLAGSNTLREIDDKTTEATQTDAEGKLLDRKVFVLIEKGQPARLQRHEEVMTDGFKCVTVYDAQGAKSSESWFNPDGTPAPDRVTITGLAQ
jgi:hypothetical protein